MVAVARGVRRRRVPVRRGVPSRRDSARTRRDDEHAVVRPDPDARASSRRARRARALMTNVFVAAYQHPLQTAKAFATLDALSSGRAIVGVGAGHVEGEFDALGRAVRRARRDHRRGDRRDPGRARPTSGRNTRARAGASRTSASDRVRCSSRARRSGSADRASPRCGASRHAATAGSRRARRAGNCPTTSRTSCGTATKCGRARCPRSGSSPRPCTSASRTSTSAGTPCPARRSS